MSPGRLFIVSAPSGAGKTTLIKQVLERFGRLSYSISHTTRPPRLGEQHGMDYFFVTLEEFEDKIRRSDLLEWAKVHGNYYGTSKAFVEDTLKKGESLLLDIDVQGTKLIMDAGIDAATIFIMPPSFDSLAQRLEKRGTDSTEVIKTRLENAKIEMAEKELYQYCIINDDLAQAVEEICRIFETELPGSEE